MVTNVTGDHVTNMTGGHHTHIGDGNAYLESIVQRLQVIDDNATEAKVHSWLAATDVSQNYSAARSKHQAGTGSWFLEDKLYSEWKENPKNILCIYGNPGCGKTILCSSIIEEVKVLCESSPLASYAYFFFDSRNSDQGLLRYEKLVRSFLSQAASRCGGLPTVLRDLYYKHGSGRENPCLADLWETLRLIVEGFDHFYAIIDSLDECGDRIELMQMLRSLDKCNEDRLHILLTSRPEPDIVDFLAPIPRVYPVQMQSSLVNSDIGAYLDDQLASIKSWDADLKILVRMALADGADGMFRWVALQLCGLKRCLNAREVKKQLQTLPKTLEKTYERILAESDRPQDLLQMLHWLAFSVRALRLEELADVVSVDQGAVDGPAYDPDLRFGDPTIALAVCAGLVTLSNGNVKLAHFSVKEYLTSDSIKAGAAAAFYINKSISHSMIAQTCLVYLLNRNRVESAASANSTSFPLVTYAEKHWVDHYRSTNQTTSSAIQALLLHMASSNGHIDVVRLLLEQGVDVDARDMWGSTALQLATSRGHNEIANLILAHEVDATSQVKDGWTGILSQWGESALCMYKKLFGGIEPAKSGMREVGESSSAKA
ncbi:hypothetical protein HWV62_15275 [Athelia sp. TMB]|nr:hypothetical protein HWV62_15275 [Athelia sp. TMB]